MGDEDGAAQPARARVRKEEEVTQRELVLQDKSNALFIFSVSNPLRKWLIDLCVTPMFDKITTVVIVLNCLILSVYDPVNTGGWRNQLIEDSEIPFLVIFTLEMVMKVIACGFILGKTS
jgi:hypothetical protein